MADAAGVEEDGIEEVLIGRGAVAEGFARVEEEGNVELKGRAAGTEPEEERGEGEKGAAHIFLGDEVKAGEKVGEGLFGRDALFHVVNDLAVGAGADGGPKDAGVLEIGAGRGIFEALEFFGEDGEEVEVVGLRRGGALAMVRAAECKSEFDVADFVGVELGEKARDEAAEDRFDVEDAVDYHEAGKEFAPDGIEAVVVEEGLFGRDEHAGDGPGFEGGDAAREG